MVTIKKDSKWPLVGNGHIVEYLKKSIATNHISGCYIFYGPDDIGKGTLAGFFAKSLVCCDMRGDTIPCGICESCVQADKGIHGDITVLEKEADKKNILVDQVREFIRILSMSSFLNSYKIGIIRQAENLSEKAFNALLKTLEEPKDKVVIILMTSKIELLLPTIVSRSQILRFNPVNPNDIYDYLLTEKKASRSSAKIFSRLCLGRPALAVKLIEDKDFFKDYQEKIKVFLELIKTDYNQRLDKIEKLAGRNSIGQESTESAKKIIGIWQGLTRDLLLIKLEQPDLIQHQIVEKDLNILASKISIKLLIKCARLLNEAKMYLNANVNYRVVLDNLSLQI